MASPSPSSPPALQPGTARQRSTSGCTHLRDHDAFPSLKTTDSSRRAGAPTQHRDELLAAIVKTPKPGQQAWGYARSTPVQQPPAAHVSKARTVWIWLLTALLVALWLGGIAALADEPSELDVMRATAAAARDVEREGAFVDGVSPWDRMEGEFIDAPLEVHRVASNGREAP